MHKKLQKKVRKFLAEKQLALKNLVGIFDGKILKINNSENIMSNNSSKNQRTKNNITLLIFHKLSHRLLRFMWAPLFF